MEREKLWSIIESLLFASERPLGIKDLRGYIDAENRDLREVMDALAERYTQEHRGFLLVEVAGGWQFRTNADNAEWVRKMLAQKPVKLSRAALETLAVIAYRQPITRAEIEDVRGVDSGGVLKMLLDRRLLKIIGKKEEIGRPSIYATSREFLEFFSLKDLTGMPTLREFNELTEESLTKLEDAGFPEGSVPVAAPSDAATPAADPAEVPSPAVASLDGEGEAPAPAGDPDGRGVAAAARARNAKEDTGAEPSASESDPQNT